MIPKIIHYCWFGQGELPAIAKKCMKSWQEQMPGVKIVRWDETNYDVTKNRYMREAYAKKKYAFVSDYARLDIIYQNGGIYLDVDVELIRPLDPILENNHCFLGFQTALPSGEFLVNTGLGFGAEPGNKLIRQILKDYEDLVFIKEDGSLDLVSCPMRNSSVLKDIGLTTNNKLQMVVDARIYPCDYFCPMNEQNGKIQLTNNTVSIHHFSASWLPLSRKIKRQIRNTIGIEKWNWIKKKVKG